LRRDSPARDSAALADSCEKLLALDSESRRALGRAAAKRVIRIFADVGRRFLRNTLPELAAGGR